MNIRAIFLGTLAFGMALVLVVGALGLMAVALEKIAPAASFTTTAECRTVS